MNSRVRAETSNIPGIYKHYFAHKLGTMRTLYSHLERSYDREVPELLEQNAPWYCSGCGFGSIPGLQMKCPMCSHMYCNVRVVE